MKKKLRNVINKLDDYLIRIAVKNKFLASIYYFFKPRFWRENKAVLHGRYQYYKNYKKKENNEFLLRRNIHRIEKGILMRPRKDIFAESYIEETVDSYIDMIKKNKTSSSLEWAYDVLKEYFSIVKIQKSTKIKVSKEKFENYPYENILLNNRLIPYKRKRYNKPNIQLQDMEDLAKYRRSVRWFEDITIEHDKIDNAINIARYSPSACNRLPYRFMIYDDKDKVLDIARCAMGTAGYLENIPAIAVVVGDLSAYPEERDRHLIYIDSSLSAMSFIYGLEVQGISSSIINWPDIEKQEKQLDKILNLHPYERVTMLIAIGYADFEGMVAYSQKKDLNEVRSYNYKKE